MANGKPVLFVYRKLVSDIARLYLDARKALVDAYWKIGKRLVEVEQNGEVRARYGKKLLTTLSADLSRQFGPGFSADNLQRMRRFYLAYPIYATSRKLAWSQYVALLPVENAGKRAVLERKALQRSLTHKELRALVRAESKADAPFPVKSGAARRVKQGPLTPKKGTLYTYRVLEAKTILPASPGLLLIDLGFSCSRDLDSVAGKKFGPGDIVESVCGANGEYALKKSGGSGKALYTYKASVEKIIDGDTLRVIVDLGFSTRTRQYLRLRGIDAPESATAEGRRATDFVRSQIKQADEIVLSSSRSDKYDRYLADVFYLDPSGREIFLNNLLLEKGHAVRAAED